MIIVPPSDVSEHSGKRTLKREISAKTRSKLRSKSRRSRSFAIARAARATTLRLSAENKSRLSNKDLGGDDYYPDIYSDSDIDYLLIDFTQQFIPDTSLEYSRLRPETKILIGQYMLLQQQQTSGKLSIPLTIRLSRRNQLLSDDKLKHRLRGCIKSALGYIPLMWLCTHHGKNDEKHLHGEMQLTLEEVSIVRHGLKKFYGLKQPGLSKAIKFHTDNRLKIRDSMGALYAHLNWVGYSSRELTIQRYKQLYGGKYQDNKFSYTSEGLNHLASQFYDEHIYRQFNYRPRRKSSPDQPSEPLWVLDPHRAATIDETTSGIDL